MPEKLESARTGVVEAAEELKLLMLDEIGEMPMATQAKLLRVLEDRRLRRLGAREEIPVNVRVIAATNRDPQAAVARGELRSDLFYRLNVFHLEMPALREHTDDIPAIATAMVAEMNGRHGTTVPGISPQLMARLVKHRWPGNARELRNTIERAVILAGAERLTVAHLPVHFDEEMTFPVSATVEAAAVPVRVPSRGMVEVSVGTTVDAAEKQLILKTLESTGNNKTRAAEILGISAKTLQNKLKEYASAA